MSADAPIQIKQKWTRGAVLIIAGLESIAMFAITIIVLASGQLTSGEALSRSLGWAILTIYGLPFLTMAAPALLLAVFKRHLIVALVLSLLMIPTVWLFSRYA